MTRSIACLWRGDPVGSVRYHPLGPFVAAGLLGTAFGALIYRACPPWRRRIAAVAAALRRPAVSWTAAGALITIWLVRLMDLWFGWRVFRW
ncbi:MAG: DUF2752 domain-containing protein [Chthonomonadales bacterium]|nr:DUF2752 domain-containing protein [Chthonomonadales bacterium]